MDKSQIAVASIFSIRPLAEFSIGDDYESLMWYSKDQEKPTEKEFNDAVTAWKAEYDSQEYARKRAVAYPSLSDQMDMIMKDNRDGTKTHQTACEAVKKKYPKG